MRILLIEDDPLVREVTIDMLRFIGHFVLAVADGRAGLARLEAGDPVDMVLTDLKMPGMSGWEVVKVIRARWPQLLTGVITGTPGLLAEQREPVDVVIRKPVRLEGLREALGLLRRGPGEAR